MAHVFVALSPDDDPIFLYNHSGSKVRQVLWGDYLTLDPQHPADADWTYILWGGSDGKPADKLKIKAGLTDNVRPLEIIFVDVGQGDGSVLITPERDGGERIIVIDAGKTFHMAEFLEQRFKIKENKKNLVFHAAVITHPDEDHYGGFTDIFEGTKAQFSNLYHNGLVEKAVSGQFEKVGGKRKKDGEANSYIYSLAVDDAATRALFDTQKTGYSYPEMMRHALTGNAVGNYAMMSSTHGVQQAGQSWLPGFAPSDNRGYTIEILGPVTENDGDGDKLRVLGSYGVTKNGHSLLLRLQYGNFSVLFGGDLNAPAEKYLLKHYTGITRWPTDIISRDILIQEARNRFRSDVMKVCHHGAADVTDEFLSAVNPAAFIISSGDAEGHVHPRPDLLGRLGRHGHGLSPVLLSTELQRSTREREDAKEAQRIKSLLAKQEQSPTDARREEIHSAIDTLARSNVEVDGAIYLKTDGKNLITAFRNEVNSEKQKWFYFRYKLENGMLIPVSVNK